jgi:hypothetical protein
MPFPAEFEEKEYEIPLYLELYHHAPLWSPGQVKPSIACGGGLLRFGPGSNG